jgi:hypothetical protein
MEQIEQRAPEPTPQGEIGPVAQDSGRGPRNTLRNALIGVGALVVVALISAAFVGLATHPSFTAVLRDISIIVLALSTAITIIFLIILLFQLQSLIVLLRDEIQPILESLNETAGTVRGTTTFVSDTVVSPMIQVASYARAVQAMARAFLGDSGRRQRRQENSDNQ